MIPKSLITKSRLDATLEKLAQQNFLRELQEPLIVLGEYLVDVKESSYLNSKTGSNDMEPSIWFIVEKESKSGQPSLREIWCYGYR